MQASRSHTPTPVRTAPTTQKSAPHRHEITDPRIQAKQCKRQGRHSNPNGVSLPNDKCIVTHSEKAPFKGDKFGAVTDTVLLYLNCNATIASATTPG